MSDADADELENATRAPDFSREPFPSLSTLWPWSAAHGMPGTDWELYGAMQTIDAIHGGGIESLGRALHARQDAFAHDRANKGMLEHLLGRPDDPNYEPNRQRAKEAEGATKKAVKDYQMGRGLKSKC